MCFDEHLCIFRQLGTCKSNFELEKLPRPLALFHGAPTTWLWNGTSPNCSLQSEINHEGNTLLYKSFKSSKQWTHTLGQQHFWNNISQISITILRHNDHGKNRYTDPSLSCKSISHRVPARISMPTNSRPWSLTISWLPRQMVKKREKNTSTGVLLDLHFMQIWANLTSTNYLPIFFMLNAISVNPL